MNRSRLILALLIMCFVAILFAFDVNDYLTLEYISEQRSQLQQNVERSFVLSSMIFVSVYIITTALSIPGALILTLTAGALFGLVWGVILVSAGSTIGATLAFLIARYFARSWVEKHFFDRIKPINKGIEKEGAAYLFALRLIPLFPFFLINIAMGLTRISVLTYMWVSAAGMFVATVIFVNAGTEISKIESVGDITSKSLLLSFVLLGMFPFIAKGILSMWKSKSALKGVSRPKRFDQNLIVIGAGAGGLVSAYIAATVNAKVLLIEKHKMGGDCLNTGCVPSKALLKVAKQAADLRKAQELGVHAGEIRIEFSEVMKYVQKSISLVEPHDSIERYTKLGVQCISGNAFVRSPYSVEVNGAEISARAIVVATGAKPFIPDNKGLDNVPFYTSDTIWALSECPKRLLIWGGGPIACEMAQAFARLGAQVTLVARSGRLMSKEDEEVSSFVMSQLSKDGVELRMGHQVDTFGVSEQGKYAECEAAEGNTTILFDEVLIALGRRANTEGFGLEGLGVEVNPSGTIKTDEYLRSNIPTVFACGDVAGPYQFTHMAAHQAWYCSVNALFGWIKRFKVDYRLVPRVTYLDPEVAQVGLNEAEANVQNIAYESTVFHLSELDRAITENDAQGFIKVITPVNKDRILGITIVGHNAGELLAVFVLAMKKGIGLNDILATIHAYPTMAEANKYVAGEWKRNHAPKILLRMAKMMLAWRRGKE